MNRLPLNAKRFKWFAVKLPLDPSGVPKVQGKHLVSFPGNEVTSLKIVLLGNRVIYGYIKPAVLINLEPQVYPVFRNFGIWLFKGSISTLGNNSIPGNCMAGRS